MSKDLPAAIGPLMMMVVMIDGVDVIWVGVANRRYGLGFAGQSQDELGLGLWKGTIVSWGWTTAVPWQSFRRYYDGRGRGRRRQSCRESRPTEKIRKIRFF